MHKETRLKKGSKFTREEIEEIKKQGRVKDINIFSSGGILYEQIVVEILYEEDLT